MKLYSAKALYSQKFKTFEFDGIYKEVFGNPSIGGCWLIYGKEKNGKTWGALLLANYMSSFKKVLYISAEEGLDKDFVDACQRAKISHKSPQLVFTPYQSLEDIRKELSKKRYAPGIIFLDNATVYSNEMKVKDFSNLLNEFPNTTFILIAHEERNEPYTALAKHCRKMAKRIIRVEGLACFVGGRTTGGTLIIDEEQAILYHGQSVLAKKQ